jgi:hypothetical protein
VRVHRGHPEVGVAGLVVGNRLEVHVHLTLVDSILKRGEDEREVKNGMSSIKNFESFFFCVAWRGAGVAWAWRSRGLSPW